MRGMVILCLRLRYSIARSFILGKSERSAISKISEDDAGQIIERGTN